MPDILYARAEHTKKPHKVHRNPMELNNSNAASAFFTLLPFYSFTFKKGYRIFHFSFFPFPLNAASAFFPFLLFYL